ncbi:MAG: class I SAM-dependent methyltransferase [Pseudomonadota bacterium]
MTGDATVPDGTGVLSVDREAGRAFVRGDPDRLVDISKTDRHGQPLRTVIDMGTGLVRNDPIPSDEDLARFYAEDYRKDYKAAERPRARQVLRNFRRVAAHVEVHAAVILPRPRVLDVGAGSGEFLFTMADLGKETRGIEPNRAYAAHCREALGLDVQTAPLSPDLFDAGSADLIRLHHVLEHLNDPVGYLAMIAHWLAPGGVLWIDVPDIEGYARSKSRGGMFHYGHIFNFCPETLRMTAALAGLAEHASTAASSRRRMGGFFERAAHPVTDSRPTDPETAARVKAAIDAHYAGQARDAADGASRAIRRPLAKLSARLEESWSAILAGGGAAAIGRRETARLRTRLRAAGLMA